MLRGSGVERLKRVTVPNILSQFLTVCQNESELIKFMTEEWHQTKYTTRSRSRIMFVTCEDRCYQLTSLDCFHEEGGDKLLHAYHAAKSGFRDVIIHCKYSDVADTAYHTYLTELGCEIFLRRETINRLKYFNMNDMFANIGKDVYYPAYTPSLGATQVVRLQAREKLQHWSSCVHIKNLQLPWIRWEIV
ncbi:hypothetical protein JTB14_010937 [Gonioctena quinquepunctata]|nr:hypothetical protein JTB14_010937 [Gonioctena quinquepunctata]